MTPRLLTKVTRPEMKPADTANTPHGRATRERVRRARARLRQLHRRRLSHTARNS